MKTYKSTLNAYHFACILVLLGPIAWIGADAYTPYREALSSRLGTSSLALDAAVAGVALAILIILSTRMRARLAQPIEKLAEQCSEGRLEISSNRFQARELRIIRDYILKTQERAEHRAHLVTRLENSLSASKKDTERNARKMEELEDLIASYGRIRTELSYEIDILRQENSKQTAKIEALQQKLADHKIEAKFPILRSL